LLKEDQKWNWIEKQEKAFKKLKKRFIKEFVTNFIQLVSPQLVD